MKTYRIRNRITKEWWDGEAVDAHEGCNMAGWPVRECWIREKTYGKYSHGWSNVKAWAAKEKEEV